jgi:uncharacterized protein (TIGR00269 family)
MQPNVEVRGNDLKCLCGSVEIFYHDRASGHGYCQDCFSKHVENTVQKTIEASEMIVRGDRVCLAVSGGLDSLVLLHIMNRVNSRLPAHEFVAVTITDDEDPASLETVKKLTRTFGMAHECFSYDEMRLRGITPVSLCPREPNQIAKCVSRRRALNLIARTLGAQKVATAHNLDDEVQTFMLNLLNGTPISHVESDSKRLIDRIKPLQRLPKKKIEAYASANSIPCLPAGTSENTRLRSQVAIFLDSIEDTIPDLKYKLLATSRKLRQRKSAVPKSLTSCRVCGEPSSREVCPICSSRESAVEPLTRTSS